MTNRIGLAEAKATLSAVVEEVRLRGERYVIQRRGRPVAAVVPLSDLPAGDRIAEDDWLNVLIHAGDEGTQLADILDEIVAERASRPARPVDLGGD
jgi:prevent-host-death family protein